MKKIFKNSSLVALGIVIGFACSTFASNETVTAIRDNVTSIFVKGEQLRISSEDSPINYKNRLYVPLRLLSEQMGLEVDYNSSNKSVYITEKPLTEEEKLAKYTEIYEEARADFEKTKAQTIEEARKEDPPKQSSVNYRELPISFRKDKFFMTLKLIVKENTNYNSEFYFDVENEGDNGIVVDAFSARFDYLDERGVERQLDLSNVRTEDMDMRALSSIDRNFDNTIYLTLDKIPSYVKQGTLSFNVYPVASYPGETVEITKVTMPIKLD